MRLRRSALFPLVAVCIAIFGAEGAAAAGVPPGFWGVVPVATPRPSQVARINRAGVDSIRAPLNWSQVERARGDFDWSSFDSLMRVTARHGVRVLPFVLSTPAWVAPGGAVLPVDTQPQREAWADFLAAAVRRYGRRGEFWAENRRLRPQPIEAWQIWNEPNLPDFAQPPDPARYLALVRVSKRAIRAADPRARILLAGIFTSPLVAVEGAYPGQAFLARLYAAGIRRTHAEVAIHPYVPRFSFLAPILDSTRLLMRRYGSARDPIWISEMGWSSLPPGLPFARGPRGQLRQLRGGFRLLAGGRRRWRIARVYWFSLTDSVSPDACGFCRGAGLFTARFRPKPAWWAFAAFSRHASGS